MLPPGHKGIRICSKLGAIFSGHLGNNSSGIHAATKLIIYEKFVINLLKSNELMLY
jgi:hypothetical protein